MSKYKEGNVFEINLGCSFAYVCLIQECTFGIFNIISDKPLTIDKLHGVGFNTYKSSKRGGISKGEWKLIGNLNLKEKGFTMPDLACYREWDIEDSINNCMVMRSGNIAYVSKEYFLELVEKNLIYGFYDNHKKFENWIRKNIEQIKANKPMQSEWKMLNTKLV